MKRTKLTELCHELWEGLSGEITSVVKNPNETVLIRLSCEDWKQTGVTRHFDIHCSDVAAISLAPSPSDEMEWAEDHILLWEYNVPHYNLFYTSIAENGYEVLGKLHEAHQLATGGYSECYQSVDAGNFIKYHKDSFGMLAHGPEPLMRAYETAISDIIDVNLVDSYVPKGGCSIILFDHGYVIAESFEVMEQKNDKSI